MSRIHLKGLLVPVEWDQYDKMIELALVADDDSEYSIGELGDIYRLENCIQERLMLDCNLTGTAITAVYNYELIDQEDYDEWENY